MIKDFMNQDEHDQCSTIDGEHIVSARILIADGTSDVANLPGLEDAAMGSVAIIIDPPGMKILNSAGEWKDFR